MLVQVRSLAPLSALASTQLQELFVACNKITAIESLDRFTNLRTLELGGNRIRALEGMTCCHAVCSAPSTLRVQLGPRWRPTTTEGPSCT